MIVGGAAIVGGRAGFGLARLTAAGNLDVGAWDGGQTTTAIPDGAAYVTGMALNGNVLGVSGRASIAGGIAPDRRALLRDRRSAAGPESAGTAGRGAHVPRRRHDRRWHHHHHRRHQDHRRRPHAGHDQEEDGRQALHRPEGHGQGAQQGPRDRALQGLQGVRRLQEVAQEEGHRPLGQPQGRQEAGLPRAREADDRQAVLSTTL